MNKRPTDVEGKEDEPVPDKVQHQLEKLESVQLDIVAALLFPATRSAS